MFLIMVVMVVLETLLLVLAVLAPVAVLLVQMEQEVMLLETLLVRQMAVMAAMAQLVWETVQQVQMVTYMVEEPVEGKPITIPIELVVQERKGLAVLPIRRQPPRRKYTSSASSMIQNWNGPLTLWKHFHHL